MDSRPPASPKAGSCLRWCTLLDSYRYPAWLIVIGAIAWVATIYLDYNSLTGLKKPVLR